MDINTLLTTLGTGQWVHAGAKDSPEISAVLQKSADACFELNAMAPSRSADRERLLRTLLGSVGSSCVVNSPFRCDYGYNIHLGDNFIGNYNLSILDEAPVVIGDNVMIGPNCSLVTITHALDAGQRADGIMTARPITIGNNVWIAANVVVLPGVEIGDGAVIGAGSVVVKSIPAGMLAVGNPCRPLRAITAADRVDVLL